MLVALLVATLGDPSTAAATVQTSAQRKCILAVRQSLGNVVKAQAKEAARCASLGSRGALTGTIEDCVAADTRGRVARAKAKTIQQVAARCSGAPVPDFGTSDAETVNTAAPALVLDLAHDAFGADLDAGILRAAVDPPGAKCQRAVARTLGKCHDAMLKTFAACTKAGLKSGVIQDPIDLQVCTDAGPSSKVGKVCHPLTGKLATSAIAGKCVAAGASLSAAFPGCATNDPGALAVCLRRMVDCRACQALSAAHGLNQDCDFADDRLANGSCADTCTIEQPANLPSVLVVGLDGASWRVLLPLIEAGHLPTIGALVDAGARADLNCAPAFPTFSCFCPPVWVSIATGEPFAVHKVAGFYDPSTARQAPAIWSVLATRGGTSTLVAYRNTWPSEPEAAFVVTEPGVEYTALERYTSWPSEAPHPGRDDTATHTQPPDLFATLGLLPYVGPQPEAYAAMARDRVSMEALTRLQTDPELGRSTLTMIIIHSPDKSEHLTWDTIQGVPGGPIDEAALLGQAAAWTGPVFGPAPAWGDPASQYLEADAWLASHLAAVAYDYVVLVSDHGMARSAIPGGFPPGHHGPDEPDAHVGIFAVAGPGIAPGTVLPRASVLDVAPTLAYLLRVPVAQNLRGAPLHRALTPEHLTAHCLERVAGW